MQYFGAIKYLFYNRTSKLYLLSYDVAILKNYVKIY